METNSRDSQKEKPLAPKDRRVPCKVVAFLTPVEIPGFEVATTICEVNLARLDGGKVKTMPQPFFDPENRSIWIEGREYPLERVRWWERAHAAAKKLEPPKIPDYTIGKR